MDDDSDSSDAESDCSSDISDISDRENAGNDNSDVSTDDEYDFNQEQVVTMPDFSNWKKEPAHRPNQLPIFDAAPSISSHPLGADAKPVDYFGKFVTADYLQKLITDTNHHAHDKLDGRGGRRRQHFEWSQASLEECHSFLYIIPN